MLLRLRPPRVADLERRIARSVGTPLSHRPDVHGATLRDEVPADYAGGEWEIALGSGAACFERACEALRRWAQFPTSMVSIHPSDAPLATGTVVALHARAGPFHADLACRVVATVDETVGSGADRIRRFGFVYATVEGHVERGEELFRIEHRAGDDRVTYRIRAVSRPAHPIAWIVQPWVRALQRRFGVRSAEALRTACHAPSDLPPPTEVRRRPPFGLPWIGLLVWAVATLTIAPPLRTALLTLAPLVVLPAARALFPAPHLRGPIPSIAWFGAATLFALAPAFPVGFPSALLTIPWTAGCGIAAWRGAALLLRPTREREARKGPTSAEEPLGAAVGALLLPVGALWATAARAGVWPGGFPEPVPELTALHFHYAGAVLPIILGRAVRSASARWVPPSLVAWVVLTLLVAVGISVSPTLETAAALALIAVGAVGAAGQLRVALGPRRSLYGSFLLATGSCALLAGLTLAAAYTILEFGGPAQGADPYTGGGVLPWPTMVAWHGTAMALGFGLTSLLGWDAVRETWDPAEPASAPGDEAPESVSDAVGRG